MKFKLLPSVLGLFLLAGCGAPSIAEVCENYGDECGSPEAEVDQCKTYGALFDANAEQLGCESEFDDLMICMDENIDCSDPEGPCATESRALQKCTDGAQ